MQVFRLVHFGFPDKLLAFDTLPERIMKNVKTKNCEGLPRYWAKWMADNGSMRPVLKTTTKKIGPGDYEFTHTPVGMEPCMFVLDYKMINSDIEKWQEICNYVRRVVDIKTRLLDRIEDMAVPMAVDAHAPLDVEPEKIPVIQFPSEDIGVAETSTVKPEETIIVENAPVPLKKKAGRPKKVAVEA